MPKLSELTKQLKEFALNPVISDEEFLNAFLLPSGIVAVVRDFYYEEVCLKPGAIEFLQELNHRNIPMVIATSSDRSYLQTAFQRNGIDGLFERSYLIRVRG